MFVPLSARPEIGRRPANSDISASDWAVLADFWYPVAIAHDIVDAPVAARLLDVDLVLYRGTDGTIACAVDLCPHRHIRLSGGKMVDGQIECPFHGLRFDTTGQCRYVPALGRETKLPASYCVGTFPVRQSYGLVWTCLGDPARHALPSFPALEAVSPEELAFASPQVWPVSAARQIENFFDLAHLPLVHANTLGGDPRRALKPGRIEHSDDAVTLRADYIESAPDGGERPSKFTYRVVLPFAIDFTVVADADPDHAMRSTNIPSPISAHQSRVFQVTALPGSTKQDRHNLIQALDRVNGEDIALLKGLAIADVPLDHRHEIHLPVDNICTAYRERLKRLGLGL